ncbi:MAG: CHAT domain-containing protein, partial [Cytophagales bacterium]|nr:CHAT domain-containing protein [Cytophagales bacterium]
FSAQLWYNAMLKKENELLEPSIFLCAPVKFKTLAYLPGTENEVKEIGQLFENKHFKNVSYTFKEASEFRIKSDALKKFQFLHLATHGLVNSRKPELSAVFLSPDSSNKSKEDGMLYSGEIYNLDIKADLVTLSACETGLGKVSKGEGVIGLTRALFYAGANNMLVSLWTVSDSSTSELMKLFYSYLLNEKGIGYPKGLSLAKMELIKNSSFSAPYYWASFVLIGK